MIRLQVRQPAAAQHPLDAEALGFRKVSTTDHVAVILQQVRQPAAAQHPLDAEALGQPK